MIKNNHKDLIYYNSLIEKKKKEEYITANSSKTKNMGPDIKNIKNNINNSVREQLILISFSLENLLVLILFDIILN